MRGEWDTAASCSFHHRVFSFADGGRYLRTNSPGSPLPSRRPSHLVGDETQHYCVISKLEDGVGTVDSCPVQQGALNSSLWDSSAEADGPGHAAVHTN